MFLEQFINDLFEVDVFIECSLEGVGYGAVASRVRETIRRIPESSKVDNPLRDDAVYERRKSRDKGLEEFSKVQIEQGNPYLFGLACVKLWSILEAAVDFIMGELLKDRDRLGKSVRMGKIRGPLLPFLQASEVQRIEYLKESFLHELGSALKVGLGKFEAPLHELGFSGDIKESVRRVLLELSEVRNLVVHKASVVDKRFKDRCPWIPFAEGEKLRVSGLFYSKYRTAGLWYLMELEQRYEERYGEDMKRSVKVKELLDELEIDLLKKE